MQLAVPVRLNTVENPHPPTRALVDDVVSRGKRPSTCTATPTATPWLCVLTGYLYRAHSESSLVSKTYGLPTVPAEILQQLPGVYGCK